MGVKIVESAKAHVGFHVKHINAWPYFYTKTPSIFETELRKIGAGERLQNVKGYKFERKNKILCAVWK